MIVWYPPGDVESELEAGCRTPGGVCSYVDIESLDDHHHVKNSFHISMVSPSPRASPLLRQGGLERWALT